MAKEWNIFTFTSITDAELDTVLRDCLYQFPQAGEAMLRGHVQSLNVHVQRERLRMSVQRLSTSGNSRHPAISRRTYSVPGPNALWHVDGNHKMIRWRLVIHGCIDGFSRVIQCSNNNRSETVLESFIKATQEYGIPSRLRSDHGGENVRIWEFMEEARGHDRGSYIAGSSVHNTQIERMWRDVYVAVSSTYVSVFTELEERNILDPLTMLTFSAYITCLFPGLMPAFIAFSLHGITIHYLLRVIDHPCRFTQPNLWEAPFLQIMTVLTRLHTNRILGLLLLKVTIALQLLSPKLIFH